MQLFSSIRCKHGLETTFCIRQIVSMALKNGKLFPVLIDLPPAPDHLKKKGEMWMQKFVKINNVQLP